MIKIIINTTRLEHQINTKEKKIKINKRISEVNCLIGLLLRYHFFVWQDILLKNHHDRWNVN